MEKTFTTLRMPVALLAAGVGLSALAGCSSGTDIEKNVPATVIGHEYHGSYDSLILVGKVLVPIYHPAEYDIIVKQCGRDNEPDADAQGCIQVTKEVTESTYQQYPDGSSIVFTN